MPPSPRDRQSLVVVAIGAVVILLAAAPYKAFELDRYFVAKELVLHVSAAVAALLCLSTRRRATLGAVDIVLALFLLASVISAGLSANWWLAGRALAVSLSGIALFWVAGTLKRAGLARPMIVAVAVAVVVGVSTSLAQAYGVDSRYFSVNRAPGGTFGNRNFAAHIAAIGLPVVMLVALTTRRGVGLLFGAVGLAIIAAVLVLSRSRASWLAVLVLSAPVGLLAVLTRDRWREPWITRRLSLAGIAALVGATAGIALPNQLDWKSDSPYLDSAVGLVNYKEGSGKGRLVQYSNSLHMTREHAALGVGPGNWPVTYPEFASRNDPSLSEDDGMTSNPWPSSDWVAFLSERGVVGLGLLLAAMFGLLGRTLRDLGRQSGARDPERVLTAITFVGTLAATAVVGAFDAVLLLAAPAFLVWTLAGVLAPSAQGGLTLERGVRGVGVALVIGFGAIAVAHSALQLAAMSAYDGSTRMSALQHAAALDPGSYRLRVKLASRYLARGDCVRSREHARAALAQFPSAPEPRRILAACGRKR